MVPLHVLLRFCAGEGRFPRSKDEVPGQAVAYFAKQAEVPTEEYWAYDWRGRTIKYHRAQAREHFGFHEATAEDGEALSSWLADEVLPREQDPDVLRDAFLARYRALKIAPPSESRVECLLASAARRFEDDFCASVSEAPPEEVLLKMDALLASGADEDGLYGEGASSSWDRRRSVLGWLTTGRASNTITASCASPPIVAEQTAKQTA